MGKDPLLVWREVPSTEKESELTLSAPSSVCCSAPDPAAQSLTVPSTDVDANVLPSGEKATATTPPEWPSSVCSTAFHFSSTFGSTCIHLGMHALKFSLIILDIGANISALLYVWSGACSIPGRLYRTNRFASWRKLQRPGKSLDYPNC